MKQVLDVTHTSQSEISSSSGCSLAILRCISSTLESILSSRWGDAEGVSDGYDGQQKEERRGEMVSILPDLMEGPTVKEVCEEDVLGREYQRSEKREGRS